MKALIIFIFLIMTSACASFLKNSIQIESNALTTEQTASLKQRAFNARKNIEDFWGPIFPQNIIIKVDSHYRVPMSIVPAWEGSRGELRLPTSRVETKTEPLVHEITHIYAPNGCRFLAEGIAVYLEEEFGENPAFPNFKVPINNLAKSFAKNANLIQLDAVSTPTALNKTRLLNEKQSYLIAGSFVRFLIERYGKDKFLLLYSKTPLSPRNRIVCAETRYLDTYGLTLYELEKSWLEFAMSRSS